MYIVYDYVNDGYDAEQLIIYGIYSNPDSAMECMAEYIVTSADIPDVQEHIVYTPLSTAFDPESGFITNLLG